MFHTLKRVQDKLNGVTLYCMLLFVCFKSSVCVCLWLLENAKNISGRINKKTMSVTASGEIYLSRKEIHFSVHII